jgi:hypothetical protein
MISPNTKIRLIIYMATKRKKTPIKPRKNMTIKNKKSPKNSIAKVGGSTLRGKSRFSKIQMLIIVAVLAVVGISLYLFSSASTGEVPVYQTHSNTTRDYMYVTNMDDYRGLQNYGFSADGAAFTAYSDAQDGRVPVYQLTNNPAGGGHHIFTASASEQDGLVKAGWKVDKVAFYAYSTPAAGRKPVYRLLLAATGEHYLTASDTNKAAFVAAGWTLEGVAFYASDQAAVINANAPVGNVDVSSCTDGIQGWTFDADKKDAAITVHVYIDGNYNDAGATAVNRTDVNSSQKVTGNHGFKFTVPQKWFDGKPHTVDVYAINIDSSGKVVGTGNVLLGHKALACATKDGKTESVPVGMCVTAASATGACTKETADQQTAFFKAVSTAASCVGMDGRTMVRCSQDDHNKQVADGTLFEAGCIGQTLDGSNRIDCSAATHNDQTVFFQGIAASSGASNGRGGSGGDQSGGNPGDDGGFDWATIAALSELGANGGFGISEVSSYHDTKHECKVWYYRASGDEKDHYKDVNHGSTTGSDCYRQYYASDKFFPGESQHFDTGTNYIKNHVDWK